MRRSQITGSILELASTAAAPRCPSGRTDASASRENLLHTNDQAHLAVYSDVESKVHFRDGFSADFVKAESALRAKKRARNHHLEKMGVYATLGISVSISSVRILPLFSARRVASSYSSRDGNCFWAFLA